MDLKKGDKIVCINCGIIKGRMFTDYNPVDLSLHKTYTISSIANWKQYIFIEQHSRITFSYNKDRFMLLSEYRKEKLKKLDNHGIQKK